MRKTSKSETIRQRGFTLTELAVVLVIVGLLTGSLLGSYSTMVSIGKFKDAQTQLSTVSDALLGFASANGRLPCPATDGVSYGASNSYGVESPSGGGACSVVSTNRPGLGYVPAATLGLTPVDSQGFLIDPWNNRILYAVTNSTTFNNEFTTQGALRTALIDASTSTPAPDLRICTTTPINNPGTTTAACVNNAQTLTNSAAAVIISPGPNGATGGTGADEAQNLHSPALPVPSTPWPKDRVYISHTQSPAGATQGEFDDLVLWISPALVYNRIMSGGI